MTCPMCNTELKRTKGAVKITAQISDVEDEHIPKESDV